MSSDLDEYTYQSIIWATAYSFEAEMTCCFVISCLPACRQLFRERISPFISSKKTSISSRLKTRSKEHVEKNRGSDRQSPVERAHDDVDSQDRWQVDSYLDTSGPEYAWMHTESQQNMVSDGRSPHEKVPDFQSARQP